MTKGIKLNKTLNDG